MADNNRHEDDIAPDQVAAFNEEFVQALQQTEGPIKEASARTGKMIKRKIRENGYWRHIIPPENVTTADLDEALEHDHPRIIEDMEAESPGAKTIPFNDGPDVDFYRGDKFNLSAIPAPIKAFVVRCGDKSAMWFRGQGMIIE